MLVFLVPACSATRFERELSRGCAWHCSLGTSTIKRLVWLMPTEAMQRKLERGRAARFDYEQAEAAARQEAQRLRRYLDEHPSQTPSPEGLAAWEAIRDRARELVEPHVWSTWLESVHPHRLRSGVWVLACSTDGHRDWMVKRFRHLWGFACQARCEFVVCDQSTSADKLIELIEAA